MMTAEIKNKLRCGDYAVARVTTLVTSVFLGGTTKHVAYHVVKVVSASRDGEVKRFMRNGSSPESVNSRVEIFALPSCHLSVAAEVFSQSDIRGFGDKKLLKSALDAAVHRDRDRSGN